VASGNCSPGYEAAGRTLPLNPTCWTPPGSSSSCSLHEASGCNPGWWSSTSSCKSSLVKSSGPGAEHEVCQCLSIQHMKKKATRWDYTLYLFDLLDFWVIIGRGSCRAGMDLLIIFEQPSDLSRKQPQERPIILAYTLLFLSLTVTAVNKVSDSIGQDLWPLSSQKTPAWMKLLCSFWLVTWYSNEIHSFQSFLHVCWQQMKLKKIQSWGYIEHLKVKSKVSPFCFEATKGINCHCTS